MRFFTVLAAALILGLCTASPASAQGKTRNVILIIADDMGMQAGCYGDKGIKTPHLDKLAQKGVRFTQGYSSVSSCSPSRASMFTGLYTHQNGQYGLQHLPHGFTTSPWVQSLPALLRAAGYYTGLIGKYHVGPDAVYPFDELTSGKGLKGNRDPVLMSKKAREFIDNAKKKPFFLIFASSDPHRAKESYANEQFAKDPQEVKYDPKDVTVPPFLPDTPETRKDLAEFYQSISRLDRTVGMLMEVLSQTGHLDDTLVIFVSDNGMPFPRAKTNLYDASVHLPLIISSPEHKQGHTNHGMVSYVDLAPTILDWAKAKGPKYTLPGRSVLSILNEENPKGWDAVFGSHQHHEITMYYPMRFIKTRQHKLLVNLAHKQDFPFSSDIWGSPTWQGVLKRKDKMMGLVSVASYLHRPLEEFFDVQKDPHELKNVASDPAHAQAMKDLRQQLVSWQNATNDPWTILYRGDVKLGNGD